MSCGFHHTAVIAVPMQSGRIFSTSLFTFGYGEFGRLGLGDEDSALSPKQVVFPAGVHPIDVACGEQHTVVACRDGNVYSWGSNAFGQLGLTTVLGASNDVVTTPQRVPLPEGMAVVQVAAGGRHTGAVTRDGKVLSWGWGEEGQLGHNSERNQLLPRPAHLPRLAGVVGLPVRLTMGMSHTLLLAYNARHIAPVAPVIPEETPAPVESAPPASPPKEEVVPPQPSPLPKPPSPAVHAPPPETHKPPILAAADDGDDVDEEEEEQQREEEEKVEAILPMAPVRGIKELLQQREERL